MKILKLFPFLGLLLLFSCDTYQEFGISNDTNRNIQFITIGGPANISTGSASLTLQRGDSSFYSLNSGSYDVIATFINQGVTPNTILINGLVIIDGTDTINLNGSQEIFDALVPLSDNVFEIPID